MTDDEKKAEQQRLYLIWEDIARKEWIGWYQCIWLESETWKQIKSKVLARDKNLCQSCLERNATEVFLDTLMFGAAPPLWMMHAVCSMCAPRLRYGWLEGSPDEWIETANRAPQLPLKESNVVRRK
nr:hypothetical protein [uncultured Rhodopila sp.]